MSPRLVKAVGLGLQGGASSWHICRASHSARVPAAHWSSRLRIDLRPPNLPHRAQPSGRENVTYAHYLQEVGPRVWAMEAAKSPFHRVFKAQLRLPRTKPNDMKKLKTASCDTSRFGESHRKNIVHLDLHAKLNFASNFLRSSFFCAVLKHCYCKAFR